MYLIYAMFFKRIGLISGIAPNHLTPNSRSVFFCAGVSLNIYSFILASNQVIARSEFEVHREIYTE